MRGCLAFLVGVMVLSACATPTESPTSTVSAIASEQVAPTTGSPEPTATPPPGGLGGAAGTGEFAFSDSHPFHADTWEIFATRAESQFCSVSASEPEAMDLDAAVANVRAFLDEGAGAGAMEAFDASAEGSTVEAAKTAAAAALVDGNEAGALAALLAAARLEPENPRHLVNAAGLLPAFGLAGEALAFLAAAEELGEPEGAPFGIDQRAVHLNNEGRALLALGRWDEAAPLLSEAVELDPTLSESATNLSLALLCQGNRDEALRFAKAGRYRKQMRFTESEGDRTSTPVPEDAFDMSVGVQDAGGDALVPALELPDTPEEGAAMREYLTGVKDDLIQRTIDRTQRMIDIQTASASVPKPQITQVREADIMLAISAISTRGDATRDPWQEVIARSDEAFAIWDEHFGPAGTVEQISTRCSNTGDFAGCMRADCIPATGEAHAAWIDVVERLDIAVRAWADAYYPTATAIAAHIGDPAQHEVATLNIQGQLDSAFLNLVSRAEEFAIFENTNRDICVSEPDPPPDEPAELVTAPPGRPCPIQAGQWSIKIGFISITADCSDWAVEASTPGPIGVFAQISSVGGETTFFAGPTASVSAGPFEAGTRNGFYVTVSETSGVRDFGVRVEPGSVSAAGGPLSITVAQAESMDFSFVGITAYLPGM
jgi:hypothetical protein